jgi:hypothetical protein
MRQADCRGSLRFTIGMAFYQSENTTMPVLCQVFFSSAVAVCRSIAYVVPQIMHGTVVS